MAILALTKQSGLAMCIGAILLLLQHYVNAEEKSLQLYEQKIKAGLVYNLLKYTAWPKESPSQTSGKLQICLFGEDPFDGYLSPLEGRTAQQAPISITHINNVEESQDCSAVIIHRNKEKNLSELLQFLENKNVLTISDISQFAQRGGMVEMAREDEKISLYINKNAVNHAGLSIQGPMLKLAKIVAG
jgi:hypothetical protein